MLIIYCLRPWPIIVTTTQLFFMRSANKIIQSFSIFYHCGSLFARLNPTNLYKLEWFLDKTFLRWGELLSKISCAAKNASDFWRSGIRSVPANILTSENNHCATLSLCLFEGQDNIWPCCYNNIKYVRQFQSIIRIILY